MPLGSHQKPVQRFKYVLGTNIPWRGKIRYKPITPKGLEYLKNKPKTIWWTIITGPPGYKLGILQDHDLVFDKYDYDIRQIPY